MEGGDDRSGAPEAEEKKLRDLALLVYVLQAVGFLIGLTWIVGVVINYLKIDDVAEHLARNALQLADCARSGSGSPGWRSRGCSPVVMIGVLIGFAVTVWAIYRVVKGWLALNDRKPMYSALV